MGKGRGSIHRLMLGTSNGKPIELAPIRVRGTNIFVGDPMCRYVTEGQGPFSDVTSVEIEWCKQLKRSEILLFRGLAVRQARRGHWAYQIADGIWSEVRTLDDIPWDAHQPNQVGWWQP